MMQKLRDYIKTAVQILGPRLFPQVAQVFMGASDLLSDPTAQSMTWFNTFRLCSFCPLISTRLWISLHLTRTTGAAGYGAGSALSDEIHWTSYVSLLSLSLVLFSFHFHLLFTMKGSPSSTYTLLKRRIHNVRNLVGFHARLRHQIFQFKSRNIDETNQRQMTY